MKKGIARPEYNSGEKLAIVVRTRTPIEAYRMLKAGMPVDQAVGWYQSQNLNGEVQDISMMDTPQKLRYILDLKSQIAIQKTDLELMTHEVNQLKNNKKIEDEKRSQSSNNGSAIPEPSKPGSEGQKDNK